jgi:hypothetical protein
MNVPTALGGQFMLKFELLRDRGVLIVTPNGSLEKADFERLAKEVDPFIASKGKLTGLLIYTESFPGWDSLGALVSHLKFVADHHRQIARIAAVTDSGFRKIIPTIATHFIEAQIRVFDFTQKAAALAWLETGE